MDPVGYRGDGGGQAIRLIRRHLEKVVGQSQGRLPADTREARQLLRQPLDQ